MSKFTEEWQAIKKSLGHMVGVMESMAAKYGECTDIEEIAKKKGFTDGYNLGIKKQKAEICENWRSHRFPCPRHLLPRSFCWTVLRHFMLP